MSCRQDRTPERPLAAGGLPRTGPGRPAPHPSWPAVRFGPATRAVRRHTRPALRRHAPPPRAWSRDCSAPPGHPGPGRAPAGDTRWIPECGPGTATEPQIGQRLDRVGITGSRRAERNFRQLQIAGGEVTQAQLRGGLRIGGRCINGPAQQLQGAVEIARIPGQDAAEAECLRLHGQRAENGRILAVGFLQAAGAVQRHGLAEQVVPRAACDGGHGSTRNTL